MSHQFTPITLTSQISRRTFLRFSLGALAAGAGLGLMVACGGEDDDDATSAAGSESPSAGASAEVSPSAEESPSAAAAQKVDPNTASEAELVAAFEAVGIPNAEKWAEEVVEYRPYPTDDLTFGKLREELAKYNPGQEVMDMIISVLTLATATSQKVNPNTASEAEVVAAFEAAGIPNAEKWAEEVVEYRPYPTDDPTFAKLREELSKYNPGEEVMNLIISVLTLSS